MKLSLFPGKKSETLQESVDIRETFALWDTLAYKYLGLERMLLWENYVHDDDLKVVLNNEKKHLTRNIKIIEAWACMAQPFCMPKHLSNPPQITEFVTFLSNC